MVYKLKSHMMHVTLRNSITRVATNTTITMMTTLEVDETGGGEETTLVLQESGGGEGEDALTKEDVFLST